MALDGARSTRQGATRHASAASYRQLRTIYRGACAAQVAGDGDRATAHLAGDFREVDASGEVLADVTTPGAGGLPASPLRVSAADVHIVAVDEAPGELRAHVRHRWRLWSTGIDGEGDNRQQLVVDVEAADTWIVTAAGPRLRRREHLAWPIRAVVETSRPTVASPRLASLATALEHGDPTALGRFWDEVELCAPLVEPLAADPSHRLVTFLWRHRSRTVGVAVRGGLPSLPEEKPLARLPRSDVWFRTERMPVTARDSYAFLVRERVGEPEPGAFIGEHVDDRNPAQVHGQSSFELPAAPEQPFLAQRPEAVSGTTTRGICTSRALGEERPYTLHTSPGFADASDRGLVVVFDGQVYGSRPDAAVPTPRIVDNLVRQGLIPATAVVLVDNLPDARSRDLACHPPFFAFVADELVPHIRRELGLGVDQRRTLAVGSSFGGLAAAYCGLRHSDVFGGVLSQSGSFWYTPDWQAPGAEVQAEAGWMMGAYAHAPTLPVRIWMEIGRFEHPRMLLTNRHLRSVLELKGYDVTYSEYDGGHSYACWRGSIADGLISLLRTPAGPAGRSGAGPVTSR